jgi:predicted alpha/beta superfamily hydrolase
MGTKVSMSGDSHQGGKRVLILEFESGRKLLYIRPGYHERQRPMHPARVTKSLLCLLATAVYLAGCGGGEAPENATTPVTFALTVPAETPANVELALVGTAGALGADRAPGLLLSREAEGRYTATVKLRAGEEVAFDIWQREVWIPEADATGAPVPRHRVTVQEGMTVELSVARWGAPSKGPPPRDGLTGIIRYHRGMSSTFLSRSRDVIVYLPPDYFDHPDRRYPVLYMHDGQNLMDPSTSFAGEWKVDEAAEQLILAGKLEPLIIVGVYNTTDRIPEYTPVADPQHGGGKADAYGRFLVEELKPFIDARYRTQPDAASTGLAGSSLGGLVSLHLGLRSPGTFTRLGVISPSVWWADQDIVKRVKALTAKPPLRLWVDMGTAESRSAITEARVLRDALRTQGWIEGADLQYVEVEGGQHNEAAWAARIGDVLKYLFPPVP